MKKQKEGIQSNKDSPCLCEIFRDEASIWHIVAFLGLLASSLNGSAYSLKLFSELETVILLMGSL